MVGNETNYLRLIFGRQLLLVNYSDWHFYFKKQSFFYIYIEQFFIAKNKQLKIAQM